jgi:hypothetical protein
MEQTPPPLSSDAPPLLPARARRPGGFTTLLSLCLVLFLADGFVSFVDDGVIVLFHTYALSLIRGIFSVATLVMAVGLYGLIGMTRAVPKRLFLPIPLFCAASILVVFPLAIFWREQIEKIGFAISAMQLMLALLLIGLSRREEGWVWPLVKEEQLGPRGFRGWRFAVFALVNGLVVLPLVAVYLFACGARAVSHFSEGFMALHPGGFTVQVRKYVRADGKAIQLFPMAHVAAPSFYQQVARTFPSNSLVLMEGVSDDGNLLTNKITYERMAKSLGLAEQRQTFVPSESAQEVVRADVDVGEFSASTIDFLNLIMLFHAKGATPGNIAKMMQYSPPPGFEKQLWEDLLVKRNAHLLGEIRSNLKTSDSIMVPWGVAHMPGLAREIEKYGFHLSETREYVVIPFGGTQGSKRQ